jgi:hypothetical protein
VSLREDIHAAYDVTAPPMGGMAERIVESARREAPVRERRKRLMYRLRTPVSLVAAILVVALVAAVFLVGRMNVRSTPVVRPTASPTAAAIDPAAVARLEAKPLHLPSLARGEICNEGPFDPSGRYGLGPVFGVGGYPSTNSWGSVWHVQVVIDRSVTGPVLMRGRDLTTHQPVLLGGENAYGPVGDPARPDLHTEAIFNMGTTPGSGEVSFPITTGLKAGHSQCVGLQFDGQSFSETFKGGA